MEKELLQEMKELLNVESIEGIDKLPERNVNTIIHNTMIEFLEVYKNMKDKDMLKGQELKAFKFLLRAVIIENISILSNK